jgi:hypothetical protein
MQQRILRATQLRIAASHTPVDDEVKRNTLPSVRNTWRSLGTTRR